MTATYKDLFNTFLKIGCLSFGGPAAQLAMMQKTIVDEKKWLDEKTYLNALAFCMLIPGPEAQQVATYVGYRLHGLKGALTSGGLFILPGLLLILALSWAYVSFGKLPIMMGIFYGLKACVLIIVIEALLRLKKRALKEKNQLYMAIIAFIALFFFHISYPIIVIIAAIVGMLIFKGKDEAVALTIQSTHKKRFITLFVGLAMWLSPLAALIYFNQIFLADVASFFAKLAVVTFGGAYSILTFVSEEAVQVKQWLTLPQMIDGLALAETTPGPLILVLTFVAFIAGFQATGMMSYAFITATLATFMTFAPSFIFILVGGDYIEKINANPRLKGALSGIMAAAVGVIAYLSLWFALQILFKEVKPFEWGVVKTAVPTLTSLDFFTLALSLQSGFMLLKKHMNLIVVMAICAGFGALYSFFL